VAVLVAYGLDRAIHLIIPERTRPGLKYKISEFIRSGMMLDVEISGPEMGAVRWR
jgi:hypothetical protein